MNTTYFSNLILGNILGSNTTPSIPTSYYMGLSTTAPTVSGTNVSEPEISSTTGYSRVNITSLIGVPSNGSVSNTSSITFSEALTAWGVITHFCVYDAATGGNLLFFGQFNTSRTMEINSVLTIASGELTIAISSGT